MANIRWGIIAASLALASSVILGIFSGVQVIYIFLRALIFTAIFFGIGFGLRFLIEHFLPELLFPEEEAAQENSKQSGARVSISVDSTGEYAVPELFKNPDGSDGLGNIEDLISGAYRTGYREKAKPAERRKTSNQWYDAPMNEVPIDRKKEAGYNDVGDLQNVFDTPVFAASPQVEELAAAKPAQAQFSPSFGDDSGLSGLPDLDMMARAFSSGEEASFPAPRAAVENSAVIGASAPGNPAPPREPAVPAMNFVPSIPVFEEAEPAREKLSGNKPQTLEGNFDPKSLAKGISTILSKD